MTVLHRKLEISLSTLSSSQWRPMVPLVLAFVAFLVWGPGRILPRLLADVPQSRAVLAGLALVAALGFALERPGHRRAHGDAGRAHHAGAARGGRTRNAIEDGRSRVDAGRDTVQRS